jgi:hypothetical protein
LEERKIEMKLRMLLLLVFLFLAAFPAHAQNRKVYEGVVGLKKKTIGTTILLEITGTSLGGWIRLEEFVPIEGGTVSGNFTEFHAGGNSYKIDERRRRIAYSGPDGNGDRLVTPLSRVTGMYDEWIEGTRFSGGDVAVLEVQGRRRDFRIGRPSLWKRQGPPFETFSRVDELLGHEISVWVAGLGKRGGSIVVLEEPEGMNIPLKAPKKP